MSQEDIHDTAEGTVGKITVAPVDIPAVFLRIIGSGGTFELVNVESLRKIMRFGKLM